MIKPPCCLSPIQTLIPLNAFRLTEIRYRLVQSVQSVQSVKTEPSNTLDVAEQWRRWKFPWGTPPDILHGWNNRQTLR
jgi:hypothetical protein